MEPRARLCCFLGYGIEHKGYHCWDPISNKLRISHHVIFWKNTVFSSLSKFHHFVNTESLFFTDFSTELFPSSNTSDFNMLNTSLSSPAPIEPAPAIDPTSIPTSALDATLHRSTRIRETPHYLTDLHCYFAIANLYEPRSYYEASTNPLWNQAMIEELQALEKTHTCDLVNLPPNKSPIGCKWIYKIKTRSDGSVEHYKCCSVAKGYTEEYGIDYKETFALVARFTFVHNL